jgi:phosphatidylglycerophosphate synthase
MCVMEDIKTRASGAYMTKQGVINLANYKYKSGAYTPLDNLLNPWWQFAANRLPVWISPNMVTLTGFFFAFTGMLAQVLTQFYPETFVAWAGLADEEVRLIVNTYTAFTLFMYQTLDAMDGKHARATGQSTPLGALFDHGIDGCVMTMIGVIMLLALFGEGESNSQVPAGVLSILSGASFFFSQWGHYHTGVLETIGVTEAQYLAMTVILAVGFPEIRKILLAKYALEIFQIPGFLSLCLSENSCYVRRSTFLEQLLPFTVDFPAGSNWPHLTGHFYDAKSLLCFISSAFPGIVTLVCIARVFFNGEGKKPESIYAYSILGRPTATIIPYVWHMAQSLALIVLCPRLWREKPLLVVAVTGTQTVYLNLRIIVCGLCGLRFPSFIRMSLPLTALTLGTALAENPRSGPWVSSAARTVGVEFPPEFGDRALLCVLLVEIVAILLFAKEVIAAICRELRIPFLAPLAKPYSADKKDA